MTLCLSIELNDFPNLSFIFWELYLQFVVISFAAYASDF